MSRQEALEALYAEIRSCTKCSLHRGRTRAVPGEGPAEAQIMFIGEGPGFHEDRQGRPFVGAAGKFLEEMLAGIGIRRDEVYIANVIKCRPPGNRDPLPDELEACSQYLDRQIELVDPSVIVTLGRFSMARYFPGAKISAIHGQTRRLGNRIVVPMLHPAAALHQPKWKATAIADMQRLPELIARASEIEARRPQAKPEPEPEQLSLF